MSFISFSMATLSAARLLHMVQTSSPLEVGAHMSNSLSVDLADPGDLAVWPWTAFVTEAVNYMRPSVLALSCRHGKDSPHL